MLESENVFVDEQVPEESSMDDEKDEEDLLGNENMVEEEDLFEKDGEEARVAHPSSQPDVLCSRTSTSVIASFESFVKNAMIGHTEDLKKTMIGEMEVFKSAVKGQLEELSIQVSNSHKTILNYVECVAREIKSIKDKIGGTRRCTMHCQRQKRFPKNTKPNVTPGNGSNGIEISSRYPYNPPNKEVDVSRVCCKRENICNNDFSGEKRKRRKNKPCTGLLHPLSFFTMMLQKGRGRASEENKP
ncbi:hypothetical protein MKW92_017389 [Papaver armeniacum]|nr:hypothetical protein MKW92_017389 [Papaver armeniacum]